MQSEDTWRPLLRRLLGVRQVLVLGFPRFVEKHPCQALRIELGGDGGTRC